MNLTQIRYFVTVAQVQNMTRAAELLHLSQPTLSKSISKLEEELNVPLFTRNGRKITLNEPGKRFLDAAMVMLQELYDATEEMDELASGTGNRLAIGIYGAHPLILRYLAQFSQLHPEVEYSFHCSIETIEHLDIADFDMLVYPNIPKYGKFLGQKLCDERYLLAVPAHHPLARRAGVLPKDFLEEPLSFLRSAGQHIGPCYALCTAMNPDLTARGFVTSPEIHREMISAGMGIGFVPEGCAPSYRRDPGIHLCPITDNKFSRTMMICFKKEKYRSALGKVLQQFLIDCLGPDGRPSPF